MIDFYESDNYRNFTTSNKTKVYSNYFRTSKHIYKILSRYIKPKSKILEIGCGGGWNLIPFLRSGHTIYGTEYSKELKKMATKFSLTDIVEIVHKFTKINKNKIYKWLLKLRK